MPERVIAQLTGRMPKPVLIIPEETWDSFELNGGPGEFILMEIVAAWHRDGEGLFHIKALEKCKTIKYRTILETTGTGVVIPLNIVQDYGLRLSHLIEVVLHKIVTHRHEMEIFPKREVFDHYPRKLARAMKIQPPV